MKLSISRVIGIVLSMTHLALFIGFSIVINLGTQDAASGLLWGIWKTVDFPVSLLAFYGFVPVPLEWTVKAVVLFVYPYVVHGVLGTFWWFLIPVAIGKGAHTLIGRELRSRR